MQKQQFKVIFYTGLAMFSMFFGAGNVVFPLDLGRVTGNMNGYAILGLLLTAVIVPFTGLLAMFLFNGDYRTFFERMGKIPGLLIICFLMALIGPFLAIPRCVTLSYSTLNMYMPKISLIYFSFGACFVLYLFTVKRRKILEILGHVLSPILLTSLIILIVKGFWGHPEPMITDYTKIQAAWYGLKEGYITMDLLGAFFFSVVILIGLRRALAGLVKEDTPAGRKTFFLIILMASGIAAALIAIIYTGFSYVTSFYSISLIGVEKDTIISVIALNILGSIGGVVANIAVSLACLTTAIALAAVFSEFIQNEVFKRKLSYHSCLLITLILTWAVSNLGFMGIYKISSPILLVCTPVLIVLTLLNIANKLFGFKPVKIPVLITFIISLILYLW